jgi:hypothetical protein
VSLNLSLLFNYFTVDSDPGVYYTVLTLIFIVNGVVLLAFVYGLAVASRTKLIALGKEYPAVFGPIARALFEDTVEASSGTSERRCTTAASGCTPFTSWAFVDRNRYSRPTHFPLTHFHLRRSAGFRDDALWADEAEATLPWLSDTTSAVSNLTRAPASLPPLGGVNVSVVGLAP